jgi:hypothetical protein
MTDYRGIDAAWQAAEQLRSVLMLLNATDITDDGSNFRDLPVRLAASGEDTAWEATDTALRIVLATLLGDHPALGTKAGSRAEFVIRQCFDNGESIRYNVGILRASETEEISEVFASQCLPADY